MQLVVNGEPRKLEDGTCLARLLEQLDLAPTRVAVEVNRELVRRAEYDNTPLCDGDQVEIVTFVGGG